MAILTLNAVKFADGYFYHTSSPTLYRELSNPTAPAEPLISHAVKIGMKFGLEMLKGDYLGTHLGKGDLSLAFSNVGENLVQPTRSVPCQEMLDSSQSLALKKFSMRSFSFPIF